MKKFIKNPLAIYSAYIPVLLISFTISYLFLLYQRSTLPFFGVNKGDAGGYILMAHNLADLMMGGIRTYGYPLFLHLIHYPSSASPNSLQLFSFYILSVQYIVYAASVFLFAFSVTKSQNMRLLIVAALLLQINILSFLSVTLTDTFSISLLLICCSVFFGMPRGDFRAFLLGLCAAFSVEIRPSNLWVYALILSIFLLEFSYYKNDKTKFLKLILLFLGGSLISFGPQMYLNWKSFHTITPLPAGHLAKMQAHAGRHIASVAFPLVPNQGLAPITIRNPFEIISPHGFRWLSINGLSYSLFKIMLMFHNTDLFVYHAVPKKYQQIMIFFSSFNTYFGLLGLGFQYRNIPFEKIRAIFIGLAYCILLHLPTQLENRYTFAICLLLMPFALYQFWQFLKEKRYGYLLFFILFFLFANLFSSMLHGLAPGYEAFVNTGAMN